MQLYIQLYLQLWVSGTRLRVHRKNNTKFHKTRYTEGLLDQGPTWTPPGKTLVDLAQLGNTWANCLSLQWPGPPPTAAKPRKSNLDPTLTPNPKTASSGSPNIALDIFEFCVQHKFINHASGGQRLPTSCLPNKFINPCPGPVSGPNACWR